MPLQTTSCECFPVGRAAAQDYEEGEEGDAGEEGDGEYADQLRLLVVSGWPSSSR